MSTPTHREKMALQLARKRAELRAQGITDTALEKALRNETRPEHTYGWVYQVWCQEVNILFHPNRVRTWRGKKAAREQALLAEWNEGKPIMGGG